ncbi:MAG: formaldehyde-activating enzyme, partial [Actinobacteria bacterium]|nr:formaldehyde-activating enzyme [Actinomycetota bacterium]
MSETSDVGFEVGEGFAGVGANAAHINTVLGKKSGPVGGAFVSILGSPTVGHIPFLVVWKPNVPVTPATLFVNKAAIVNDRHGELTWGAAQAGVAHGVTEFASRRFVEIGQSDAFVLLTAVWVNPEADDAEAVYRNNHHATVAALEQGSASPT